MNGQYLQSRLSLHFLRGFKTFIKFIVYDNLFLRAKLLKVSFAHYLTNV